MLKKTDGLANDAGINLVAQVRDGGETGVLNRSGAEVFGKRLCEEENDQGESKNRPDVVNPGGEIIVQVKNAAVPGKSPNRQSRTADGRIENEIDGQLDHEGDGAFGHRDKCDQNYTQTEPEGIGPQVSEQTLKLW